jgi:hypothetical protein
MIIDNYLADTESNLAELHLIFFYHLREFLVLNKIGSIEKKKVFALLI